MGKENVLIEFHKILNDQLYKIEMQTGFPNQFYQALLSGDNTLYQKNITEVKTFHEDWIKTIESYFPSIDKITRNAKSGLSYHEEIVAIERAKKTNSSSVRHLASNTHMLKEVRANMVVPNKIQITQSEIDLGIYENRFVKTLIERLFDFVMRRYRIVKKNIESYDRKHFNMKSSFKISDSDVELDINLNIKNLIEFDTHGNSNYDILRRINNLLKLINGLRNSLFMEELKNSKMIKPPIIKTTILLKNVDYKNCYTLWLYLDIYNTVDFDVDVKEQNLPFDKYYLRNTYQTALMAFSTVYANQEALKDHYKYIDVKKYTKKSPKIAKKHLQDIVDVPESEIAEDTAINQHYLEESMKIFEKSIDKHSKDSSSHEVALKKALRDTLNISNSLYSSFFEFEEVKDDMSLFFERMAKEDNEENLKRAKEKAKIIRMIREVKEVDFNNTIRQEKRSLKEIASLEKILIKELKRKAITEAKKTGAEERLKIERRNLAINQLILNDHLKYIGEQKQLLNDQQRESKKKSKENAQMLKEEGKRLIELEKTKAKKKYTQEINEIRKKQAEKKKQIDALLKKKKRDRKAKEILEEKSLKKKTRQMLAKKKQDMLEKQKAKLKKEKAKLRDMK